MIIYAGNNRSGCWSDRLDAATSARPIARFYFPTPPRAGSNLVLAGIPFGGPSHPTATAQHLPSPARLTPIPALQDKDKAASQFLCVSHGPGFRFKCCSKPAPGACTLIPKHLLARPCCSDRRLPKLKATSLPHCTLFSDSSAKTRLFHAQSAKRHQQLPPLETRVSHELCE